MAAGDLALMILLDATDAASAVVLDMAANYDSALSSMTEATVTFADAFAQVDAALSSAGASLSGLDASASAADSSLASVDASLSSVDTSLSALDASAASAEGALSGIDASASGVDASFATLDAAMAEMSAVIAEGAAAAATLDTSLSSLDAAASAVDASLAGVDATASITDGTLAGISASAATADSALAGIDAAASGADSALTSVDASASGADGALGGMAGMAAAMQASIDALTAAIGTLAGAIDRLAGSVAAADGALATEAATADAAAASFINLSAAQDLAGKMGGALSNLKMPALLAGAALIGIGVASIKMAGDFESGLTTLQTGAGELSQNMNLVRQGILNVATSTGTTTKALISGMFMIESASYHGAAGLDVLRVAAEGSKVGNADLGIVANALTTVMNDYGIKAKDAATAMNFLTGIVQNGKTTMQDLASSMATVLPTASAVKVHLVDVGAAMATMTGEGVPAANAATYLRQMLISLSAPSTKAQTALKDIGLTTQQVSSMMKQSLPATLQMIMQHLDKTYKQGSPEWTAAMVAIAGGSKQMQGMLDLTGQHMSTFEKNMQNVSGVMNQNKGSVAGWSKVQQDFNQQLDQAKAVVEVFMIQLGTQLAPVFGRLMAQILPLIKNFAAWENQTHFIQNAISGLVTVIGALISAGAHVLSFFASNHAALVALGVVLVAVAGAIGGVLVIAFIAWAIAAWNAAIATIAALWPILAIGAAIALVVLGIILVIQHWGQIVGWLKGVWSAFSSWFGGVMSVIGTFFHNVWNGIASFFVGVWNHIVSFAKAAWNVIVNVVKVAALILLAVIIGPIGMLVLFIITHWTQVKTFLANIWNGIVSLAKSVWNNIVGAISGAIKTVVGWFSWLYNHNYYFKDLVDGIRNLFTGVKTFITNLWQSIVAWVVERWTYLKLMAEIYFMLVYVTIQQKITQVKDFLTNIWTTIVTWITTQWTLLRLRAEIYFMMIYVTIQQKILQVQSFVMGILNAIVSFFTARWNNLIANTTALWSRISSIFSSAWNTYIAGPLGSLWNSIWTTVTGWGSKIWQAGQNLISMLAQGIASGAGMIWNAVKGIAGQIWSALGFHSPAEKGPGADADTWMPNLINMLSSGLIAGIPQMQRAALRVAATLSPLSGPTTTGRGRAFALSGANSQALALSGSGGGNQTIVIQMQPQDITLDGQKVGTAVSKVQAAQVRRIGGYRNG